MLKPIWAFRPLACIVLRQWEIQEQIVHKNKQENTKLEEFAGEHENKVSGGVEDVCRFLSHLWHSWANKQPAQAEPKSDWEKKKTPVGSLLKYKIAIVFKGISSDVRCYENFRFSFPFFTPKDPFFHTRDLGSCSLELSQAFSIEENQRNSPELIEIPFKFMQSFKITWIQVEASTHVLQVEKLWVFSVINRTYFPEMLDIGQRTAN